MNIFKTILLLTLITGSDTLGETGTSSSSGHANKFTTDTSFNGYRYNDQVKKNRFKVDTDDKYWNFIPQFVGVVNDNYGSVWESNCYKKNQAIYSYDEHTNMATVHIKSNYPKKFVCFDLYYLITNHRFNYILTTPLKNLNAKLINITNFEKQVEFKNKGIQIFYQKQDIVKAYHSLVNTYELFNSDNAEEKNLEFIKEKMNKVFYPTQNTSIKSFNYDELQNGDIILVSRFDGLDPLIMWGTGSTVGHVAFIIEIDGQKYVTESTDRNPLNPNHCWKPPYGIIKNPIHRWFNMAQDCKMNVLIIRPNYPQTFNWNKAVKFVKNNEGSTYGYYNFVFGWLDTINNNYPGTIVYQNIEAMVNVGSRITDFLTDVIHKLFGYAMTKRLHIPKETSMQNILDIMAHRDITFGELMAIPENDLWIYNGQRSMVCDVYVTSILKAGGIFGGNYIEATEFTPKDLYQLKIYNSTWNRNINCLNKESNKGICQVLGKTDIPLPQFNTIDIYNGMNEECSSKAPFYLREEFC